MSYRDLEKVFVDLHLLMTLLKSMTTKKMKMKTLKIRMLTIPVRPDLVLLSIVCFSCLQYRIGCSREGD